ncbi:amino acid ABC transporter substrate-binding protein [Streptococcus gallolyticus subsp. gallolyticus]|nr:MULTISPECIES: transporter substrate-binding domain-containing protein [Streptococcus]AQP42311.1 amino acid ABC transporter substrate bindingprotein [Streptococcus gallolyticus subsp. gallolyticus DSM 16831]MCF1635488.1 transporter substrate-binding domain-containing protein [Streptococcus gallolyticus]MCO7177862.1 transporter substrate-binding domain-containing protein [Streptococcus gallolyticus]MCR5051982.1 transporter substrate-binding domain-containing protein [Streptococcus sp.]MCY7165
MKKKVKWIISIIVVALVGLLIFDKVTKNTSEAKSDSSEKITVVAATSGSPKPFTYEEDGELTGQNIELIKAVFEKLPQYKLKIVKVEFSSIFSGLTSGRYQIAVNNLAKNAEREKNYLFTDPIFKNSYVVIFKNGSDKAKTADEWSDLAGLSTVGSSGVNSTTAIEEYNKANPDNTIELNYSSEDLKSQLEGVESGKYDFLVMDKPMFEYYQKEYSLDLTGKTISGDLSTALMSEPYSYFVVGKEETQLAEDINAALKEVVEDGTSKQINEKYFDEDYSPTYDD